MATEKSLFSDTERNAERYLWLKKYYNNMLAGVVMFYDCPRGTLATMEELDKIIDIAMENKPC